MIDYLPIYSVIIEISAVLAIIWIFLRFAPTRGLVYTSLAIVVAKFYKTQIEGNDYLTICERIENIRKDELMQVGFSKILRIIDSNIEEFPKIKKYQLKTAMIISKILPRYGYYIDILKQIVILTIITAIGIKIGIMI